MSFDAAVIGGDFVFENGDIKTVSDSQKLIQDILKICITPVGANPLQPWYGSFINKTLIGSVVDAGFSETVATNQLQDALENLKKLQDLQIKSGTQPVSPAELIAAIRTVSITRDLSDPRQFNIFVSVLSKTFATTTVSFQI